MATDTIARVIGKGTEVAIPETGVKVTVYPMGLGHLRKFSASLGDAVGILGRVDVSKDADEDAILSALLPQLVPYVLTHLTELVEECVVIEPDEITLEQLPHWDLPPIVEAWIDASFGSKKKWAPWLTAIENLVRKITGKEMDLLTKLTSAMPSSSSSPPATRFDQSSTTDSPDGHTADGLFLKSNSGARGRPVANNGGAPQKSN